MKFEKSDTQFTIIYVRRKFEEMSVIVWYNVFGLIFECFLYARFYDEFMIICFSNVNMT